VDLLVEMVVPVPVHVTGESPLTVRGDAVLNLVHNTLDVRALPADVPSAINVDVSGLDSFDKSIFVRDLTLPENVKLELAEDELLVSLTASRAAVAESEEQPVEETSAEPELVRERREDEEDAS
jgi:large subunit ribosomal protein L25